MATLIPTCPTSISFWNLRPAQPDEVKIEVPLPFGLALMKAIA